MHLQAQAAREKHVVPEMRISISPRDSKATEKWRMTRLSHMSYRSAYES